MNAFLLSQILAAIAFACGVISFQCKRRRSILFWLSGSAMVNSCHFFVLDRPAPGTLLLILSIRSLAAAFSVNRRLMYLFLSLVLVGFFLSYKNPLSFLALCATVLATYGSFQKTDQRVRVILMICAAIWTVHNALAKTPVAALMEATFLTSNLVGYWRFYLNDKSARWREIKRGPDFWA